MESFLKRFLVILRQISFEYRQARMTPITMTRAMQLEKLRFEVEWMWESIKSLPPRQSPLIHAIRHEWGKIKRLGIP